MAFFIQQMCVISIIPWLNLKILPIQLTSQSLNLVQFHLCLRFEIVQQIMQQTIYSLYIFSHPTLQHKIGIGFIAQQLSLFPPQVNYFTYYLIIVVFIAMITFCILCQIQFTTQIAMFGISHERPVTWSVQRYNPSGKATFFCRLSRLQYYSLRQSFKLFFISQMKYKIIRFFKYIL